MRACALTLLYDEMRQTHLGTKRYANDKNVHNASFLTLSSASHNCMLLSIYRYYLCTFLYRSINFTKGRTVTDLSLCSHLVKQRLGVSCPWRSCHAMKSRKRQRFADLHKLQPRLNFFSTGGLHICDGCRALAPSKLLNALHNPLQDPPILLHSELIRE